MFIDRELVPYFIMDSKGNILEANEYFKDIFKPLELRNINEICLDFKIFRFSLEKEIKIDGVI